MKRSIISWTSVVAMVVVLGLALAPTDNLMANPGGPPVEFTADFRSIEDGKTTTGKYFFGNPGFRMEGSEGGTSFITLYLRSSKQMISLIPEHRMYMEVPLDPDNLAVLSADSDTDSACGGLGEGTLLGRERLSGRAVEKWHCVPQMGSPMTLWFDPRLQFAIRTEREDGGVFELTNIQEGRVDPRLFEVPTGYSSPFGGMGGMLGGDAPQSPPAMPQMPGTPPPRSR